MTLESDNFTNLATVSLVPSSRRQYACHQEQVKTTEIEYRVLLRHLLLLLLALLPVSSSLPADKMRSSVRILKTSLPVFPDSMPTYLGGAKKPLAPPVNESGVPPCVNSTKDTFCEEVDHYPEKEIRRVINYTSEEFAELFGTAKVKSRKAGDSDEDTVCPQQSRLFFPKAALNGRDQWTYVVNDADYVQTVTAEICQGAADQPCSYMDGQLPYGMSSRCRQKFAYKRMLALHPNKTITYTDDFRFPSCCVCHVKRPFLRIYYPYKLRNAQGGG